MIDEYPILVQQLRMPEELHVLWPIRAEGEGER